jgi:TPR repeat protein
MATTVLVLLIALGMAFQIIARREELAAASNASKVTDCDRLAAHPSDTQKLAAGVAQADVKIATARDACHKALAASPGDGRILYQLGRTYFYDGQLQDGIAYFEQSAEAGYAQGQFVLGLIYVQGNGVEPDACRGGDLWMKAARQQHLYSKIFLVNNWLDGFFQGCGLDVIEDDLKAFVMQARDLADTPKAEEDVITLQANWDARRN